MGREVIADKVIGLQRSGICNVGLRGVRYANPNSRSWVLKPLIINSDGRATSWKGDFSVLSSDERRFRSSSPTSNRVQKSTPGCCSWMLVLKYQTQVRSIAATPMPWRCFAWYHLKDKGLDEYEVIKDGEKSSSCISRFQIQSRCCHLHQDCLLSWIYMSTLTTTNSLRFIPRTTQNYFTSREGLLKRLPR